MDQTSREIIRIIHPQPTIEGAGVRLKRSIATNELDYLDPFLLFDHFGSDKQEDYIKGFPMHPHRGIETVTYMLDGIVTHKDSLGNQGEINPLDVQWMTSGGGILHEEMPTPLNGRMEGFQLWVNMSAKTKMSRPKYRGITAEEIPEVNLNDGVVVRVIAGKIGQVSGPVTEISNDPTYFDISMPPNARLLHPVKNDYSAFIYVFEGSGICSGDSGNHTLIKSTSLGVLSHGDVLNMQTRKEAMRFLFVAGKPLHEPIARYGPFVMNTQDEISQTLQELRDGTFIKN